MRIVAAEALARLGQADQALPVLVAALGHEDPWVRLYAVNVLDRLGPQARPALESLTGGQADRNEYVRRVVEHAVGRLRKPPAGKSR